MENDPLELLIVPRAVIEWQEKQGLLMKRFFPKKLKEQREKGKYAIFHSTLRLNGLFDTREEAEARIEEIIGNKRKCIENKRIYSVKQL